MSRRVWIIAFAAGLLAGPAWASKVVEVRVGNHPTFTRVVFELDAPAGYQIERRTAEDGTSEILVTLEASSTPRSVTSHSAMVERVAVQDGRPRSVAHIRLKKSPSRVKEMILPDPPRIVFDLMLPEQELLAVERAAARKAQAKAESQAEKTKEMPAAEPPKLATAPKPAPKPTAAPKSPEPAAEPVPAPKPPPTRAAQPTPKPSPPPTRAAQPTPKPSPPPTAVAQPEPKPSARAGEPKPSAAPEALSRAEAPKQAVPPEPKKPEALAQAELPEPAVKPLPREAEPKKAMAKKPAAAPAPKPVPAPGGGIDWITWGGVAAGVLVLLLVIVLVLRRRALPNDLDVTALAEEESGEGGILDGGFAMGEQAEPPSMGEQAAPERQQPTAENARIPQKESRRRGPEIAAGPGLFDDEPEKENEKMDIETPDRPMERTASELPTQIGTAAAGAAGQGDIARLVQELERRVAQLETRLDEAVDARERLERQVAAQSEELRVQRAAIARTQRALRSLNRGEEEQATEPALREPSS